LRRGWRWLGLLLGLGGAPTGGPARDGSDGGGPHEATGAHDRLLDWLGDIYTSSNAGHNGGGKPPVVPANDTSLFLGASLW
jgi:hypothetical protein